MKRRVIKLIGNKHGATAIEYGLIVGLIAMAMLGAVALVGSSNGGGWGNVANNVGNSLPST